ncbi:MAG TPA: hypothetical protein VG894_02935 [Bauldia sp.]|nr:hypothetical protein [Bauldia sp.]
MMRRAWGATVLGFVALALSACADPRLTVPLNSVSVAQPEIAGSVYLIRGGFNIFSTGMDELAEKLRRVHVDAKVVGHATWRQTAQEIRREYAATHAPIVLIGHSWGALAAALIAADLNQDAIPVALLEFYDSTDPITVTLNVRHVINYMSLTGMNDGAKVRPATGFTGIIDNVNEPQYGHLNIDNADAMHQLSIADVLAALKAGKQKAHP